MQKQTIVLLLLALMALGAGAFLVPNLFREAPAPVMRWDADDEVDGVEEAQPEPETAESAALDRTEAALEPAKPQVTDDEARVDALLRGRVIDKFNAPVAGAKVWLEIGRSRQTRGRGGRDRGGWGGRSRRIPEPVVTNEQGLFAFQGQTFRNLRVSLQVKSDKHAVGLFTKDVGDIQADGARPGEVEVALGDLQLKAGGLVRGRVTDLAGNAVIEAEVKMEPDYRNRLRWQRNRDELLPPTTTDTNGFYVYENVPEGAFAVTVLAKMHTPGRSDMFEVAEDAVVEVPDIALGPGYEISGVVLDARGEPVAKASVRLRSSLSRNADREREGRDRREGREGREGRGRGGRDSWRGMEAFGGRDNRTETDEEGKFFLEHLPGSLMELRVRAKGFLDHEQDEIDPKLNRQLFVTMQDGLRITGLVQTPDGLPLTRYSVQARRLRGLPDPNKPELDLGSIWAKMSDPNLSEDGRRDLMRQMRSARDTFTSQFRGRGGDRGGRGDERGGRGRDRGGRGGERTKGRDEEHEGGRFTAEGLQEGVYEVVVEADDFARFQSAEVQVRSDAAPPDLTITMDRGVYVAGVVLDQYGDPVTDAEVVLRSASLDENNPPQLPQLGGDRGGRGGRGGFDMNRMAREWMRGMSGPPQRLESQTDEDGLFIVKNVQRGVYALSATAEGFAEGKIGAFQLNNDRSDFELRLTPLGVIFGKVTGFRPEEVRDVQVGALMIPEDGNIMGAMMGGMRGGRGGRGGRGMSSAKIDADGNYRLEGLKPGAYIVRTWVGDMREAMRMLQPMMMGGAVDPDVAVRAGDETRFDLLLTRPQVGAVAGTVFHNGDNAAGFRVELRPQSDGDTQSSGDPANEWIARIARWGRNKSATVKGDGTFEIKDVNAGVYTLRITASRRGGTLYQEQVQVLAATTLERSFSLTTGSLQGVINTTDGNDAKEVGGKISLVADLVEIPDDLNRFLRENTSFDARIRDGAFELKSLPTGTYLLIAQPRKRARTSQTVVINGAETCTVTVGAVTQEQNGGAPK